MGACGSGNETEREALFSAVAWYRKPSFADVLARVSEARPCGVAVDRGTMLQGITHVSVPVLSPSWALLLVLTAAGRARLRRRRRRAAEPRHAIGGAAFRERALAASRVMSSMTRWRGRQHGWIASGCRPHCNGDGQGFRRRRHRRRRFRPAFRARCEAVAADGYRELALA